MSQISLSVGPDFAATAVDPTALQRVRASYGKSYLAQVLDIAKLQFGPGRISPKEYVDFRLFDTDLYSEEERRRFVGHAAQGRIFQRTSDRRWWMVAHDKLLYYAAVKGSGFRAPRTRAVLHPNRTVADARLLRNGDELAAWLRSSDACPFFSKPVTGMFSTGAGRIESFDADTDSLLSSDGARMPVADFVAEAGRYASGGYLFQEILRPHPVVAEVVGDRLATVRLVVMLTDDGPEVFRALWKIPAGDNIADNYWRPGNLMALLDPDRGIVVRTVRGRGLDMDHPSEHPESGVTLPGVALQDWKAAVALCLEAACAFPGIRLQGWDVALTGDGPMLLELNIGGDFNLPQLASGEGIMDERFARFLAGCVPTS